jgi:hypothetical protein
MDMKYHLKIEMIMTMDQQVMKLFINNYALLNVSSSWIIILMLTLNVKKMVMEIGFGDKELNYFYDFDLYY